MSSLFSFPLIGKRDLKSSLELGLRETTNCSLTEFSTPWPQKWSWFTHSLSQVSTLRSPRCVFTPHSRRSSDRSASYLTANKSSQGDGPSVVTTPSISADCVPALAAESFHLARMPRAGSSHRYTDTKRSPQVTL